MSSTKSPPGHIGNLTEEQETKLREAWTLLGKFIGMKVENTAAPAEKAAPKNEAPVQEKKKSRRSWFGFGGNNNDPPTSDSASTHSNGISITDGDDKYGTMKDFQQTIADKTPEQLRQTLWGMLKKDHPDALLLRFLRARKWDVNKAVIMLISTLRWRADQYHVDDDIILNGEEGALKKANDSNASDKRVASDFIAQYKMGKSFVHGIDKEGRPVSVVRVKTHKIGAHSNEAVEKFTVHQIETARLMLQGNVETVVLIFDMTGFTLANMDYQPVKFIIKCFEANFPESLGFILIHEAPWIFNSIWKIIRGWLDPVVAAKVNFTYGVGDLEKFIARENIIKELGGDDPWEYKYLEVQPGENERMKDTAKRDEVLAKASTHHQELQDATKEWIVAANKGDQEAVKTWKAKREEIIEKVKEVYWELDPYIRARSYYDRAGVILPGGEIDFYPERKGKDAAAKETAAEPVTETVTEKVAEGVAAGANPTAAVAAN